MSRVLDFTTVEHILERGNQFPPGLILPGVYLNSFCGPEDFRGSFSCFNNSLTSVKGFVYEKKIIYLKK